MKYVLIICLLSLIFLGALMPHEKNNRSISPQEKLVNIILENTEVIIEKRHHIKACGAGVAMPGGVVKELVLAFTTKGQFSKEHLRKLLIDCAQEMVLQAKLNSEIEDFMEKPPFSIKNVQIIIYNHDKEGRGLRDPEISTAQIAKEVLTYRTIDPEDEFQFKNEFKETYDEALKLIGNQATEF